MMTHKVNVKREAFSRDSAQPAQRKHMTRRRYLPMATGKADFILLFLRALCFSPC
jgi:hypothetical protein